MTRAYTGRRAAGRRRLSRESETGAIMDVVQKVRDLSNMAFDERGNVNERLGHAIAALRLVNQFLLGKKKIDVAADIANKIMNPDFVEGVAVQAEKIAGSVDRIFESGKRVLDRFTQSAGEGRGRRGGKRKYGGR